MSARAFALRMQEQKESSILNACLRAAGLHPKVGWVCRMNSGGAYYGDQNGQQRYVRFHTMPGMSDIVGQLRDGRFLALECKRPGKHPTEQQQRFLDLVRQCGGVSGVVRSAQDVIDVLGAGS